MSAAKESKLKQLHDDLAKKLTDLIKEADPAAATLNVARQFLRDNGINCDPDNPSDALQGLKSAAERLDEFDDDDIPDFVN
jgi:hypothetical protein